MESAVLNFSNFDNAIKAYWDRYLKTLPTSGRLLNPHVEANYAGNQEITDILLELYLCGKKTAGSGLLKDYQTVGDPLPEIGRFWIILDSKRQPRCIVKTIEVVHNKFKDVPLEIAQAEGEGDLSLEYWRHGHRGFFTPFLKEWGVEDLDEAVVVTEFFELVYK